MPEVGKNIVAPIDKVTTKRLTDLPDMPKRYACPKCNASSRRVVKTLTGAIYRCRTHGKFLITVRAQ